ncbi:MAG: DNA translocase FtsK [Epsilonproteobacteria bacterium]|nr:DNA translocase FtsK [Campylobacterota bacterium]
MLFFGLSTALLDAATVGKIGHIIGLYNREYFGYLSFVYPFLLMIPAYYFYRYSFNTNRKIEIVLSIFLLFFVLLMFQGAVVDGRYSGYIGKSIDDAISDFIGEGGLWIFIVMSFLLSMVILLDASLGEVFRIFIVDRFIENRPKEEPKKRVKRKRRTKPKKSSIEADENQKDEDEIYKEDIENKVEDDAKEEGKVEILSEVEENKKLLQMIETQEDRQKPTNFKLPPTSFLTSSKKRGNAVNENEIDKKIKDLLAKLSKFKIEGDVVRTYTGPVVTTFEFKPAPHVKVSKILTLQDDLAMALKAKTIRIQAPIPGKDVVGIEIPNKHIETIYLRDIIESELFQKASSPLTLALGKDIVGNPFLTDLKKLPHLLIAGTTGSGKSVGINAMILSLLYKNSPDNLKLILIDPKMLEFSIFNDIPHLLTPVITEPKKAIIALANTVAEMEKRYKIMSKTKTKNIEGYNEKAKKEGLEPFPYIVVVIDELADLMMTSGKEVEFYIARLAQMARASGIHLIVATQRPSVDVVTGLIKANLPSRISFKVGQKIDSKIILDAMGAESLLGRGDMLFTPPGVTGLIRLHAPFTTEDDIEKVVEFLKSQREAEYDESFLRESVGGSSSSDEDRGEEEFDELYEEAKNIVLTDRKSSISYIQRKLQIGYNRAARIVEQLETMGVLSPPNSKGQREIL